MLGRQEEDEEEEEVAGDDSDLRDNTDQVNIFDCD